MSETDVQLRFNKSSNGRFRFDSTRLCPSLHFRFLGSRGLQLPRSRADDVGQTSTVPTKLLEVAGSYSAGKGRLGLAADSLADDVPRWNSGREPAKPSAVVLDHEWSPAGLHVKQWCYGPAVRLVRSTCDRDGEEVRSRDGRSMAFATGRRPGVRLLSNNG